MNIKRLVTLAMGLSLALSFVGCEWTYDYSGGWWFWLRGASRVLPSIVLLSCGLLTGAFIPRSGRAFLFGFALLIPLTIYCVHIISIGSEVITVEFRETALTMVQSVLCGLVGYWIGRDGYEVGWLLNRIAVGIVLASYFDLLMKITGLANEFEILQPGWPAFIIIIFGYCWYLNDLFSRGILHPWTVIALGGCALSLLVDFHKPIIFAAIVCSLILLFVAIRANGFFKVIFPMTVATVIGLVGFFSVDQIVGHRISRKMMDIVETKFLHQDRPIMTAQTTWEIIDLASGNRINIWTQALEHFSEKPIFGWGPGQKYASEATDMVRMENIVLHEVYLELLMAVGLVGALPLFLCVIWWYKLMLRKPFLGEWVFIWPRVPLMLPACSPFTP